MDKLDRLIEVIRADIPGFRIAFKDESWVMRALGVLLFFTPRFMTHFTTTIGRTVYVPTRAWLASHPDAAFRVLAHEYVHLWDAAKQGRLRWQATYLLPQLFALGALPSILAIWFGGRWLWCLAYLLALAPWPSPWRARRELRGYAMDVCTGLWMGHPEDSTRILDLFVGWGYYRMVWGALGRSEVSVALWEWVGWAASYPAGMHWQPYARVASLLGRDTVLRGAG